MLLQDDEGPSTQGIGTLREVMRESRHVVLACLLDPRYKNHAFSSYATLTKAKEWLKEDVQQEAVIKEISQEENAATERTNQEENAATEGASEEEEEQAAAQRTHEKDRNPKRQRTEQASYRGRIDEMFNSLLGHHTGDPSAKACIDNELHTYLKEPVIDRQKADPLQWWQQNEARFNLLASQARKYLCSPLGLHD